MIKINLLGDDTHIEAPGRMWLVGYVASIGFCLLVFYFLNSGISSEISDLSQQQDTLKTELAKLEEVTKEVRELEAKKKELNNKLAVIARLKLSKRGPVRVLDDLNLSLPEKSWLVEVKEVGGIFKISGLALDNQTIASFMKGLESSDYFHTVDLVETRQTEKKQVKMKYFIIQAKVNYAGKLIASTDPDKEEGDKKNKKA